jgi:hypothetical protein
MNVPQRYLYIVTASDPATKRTLRLSTPNLRAARTKSSFLRVSGYTEIDVKRIAAPATGSIKASRRER